MSTDKKPEPKDFPPESPHDLEWGGYNHTKYSTALEQWEQRNIQKQTTMTDTTKRYRLKKDYVTPRFTYAKGADVAYLGGMYVIGIETFTEEALKSTPDWFEEVLPVSEPVKERIEISSFNTLSRFTPVGKVIQVLEVVTDKKITGDKFHAIKQAIESALNDTVEDSKIKELESLLEYYQAEFNANQDKVYTQAEVDAIRADTWYAARKITDKVVGEIDFKDGDRCPFYEKYFNSINDYLSSLNLNSNDTQGKSIFKWDENNHRYDMEQPTNDNAFVWTDALVMEIIGLTHRAGYHKEPARVYDRIQSFRQSKQSAPEPSALPTKEYEILSFSGKVANYGFTSNPRTEEWVNKQIEEGYPIHSVRRLKDSEVFQIGDKIGWGIHDSYETTLTGFEIVEGRLKFNDSERPAHCKWADFLNAVNLHKK